MKKDINSLRGVLVEGKRPTNGLPNNFIKTKQPF